MVWTTTTTIDHSLPHSGDSGSWSCTWSGVWSRASQGGGEGIKILPPEVIDDLMFPAFKRQAFLTYPWGHQWRAGTNATCCSNFPSTFGNGRRLLLSHMWNVNVYDIFWRKLGCWSSDTSDRNNAKNRSGSQVKQVTYKKYTIQIYIMQQQHDIIYHHHPLSNLLLHQQGSDLEEVILNDAPISPTTPRLRTEGEGLGLVGAALELAKRTQIAWYYVILRFTHNMHNLIVSCYESCWKSLSHALHSLDMLRGLTAFAERSPTTPRRNWLSRLGRGLRPLAANPETWRSWKKLSPFSHLFTCSEAMGFWVQVRATKPLYRFLTKEKLLIEAALDSQLRLCWCNELVLWSTLVLDLFEAWEG